MSTLKQSSPELKRRGYIRLDSVFPVQFNILSVEGEKDLSGWLQGFTSNISKSGICLTLNNLKPELANLLKNEQIRLSLKIQMPLSAVSVPAKARIVWVKEISGQPDSYLIGLNYTEIADNANNRIMRYATAKKMFVPAISTLIIILFLGSLIGSYLHVRMAKEDKAMKINLQAKIKLLQMDITAAEERKTILQKEIEQGEKIHQAIKAKLEERISQTAKEAEKKIQEFNLQIKKLSKEKDDLHKQLAVSETEKLLKEGMRALNEQNYEQAISEFTKAVELSPNNADAYNRRGFASNAKGDFDKALLDFSKAIELAPDNADAYNIRGFVYERKGEFDKAILDFTKAIELKTNNNPNDLMVAYIYNSRAQVYYQKKDYDKTWADLNKAIALGAKVNPQFIEDLKKASGK